MTYDTVFTGLKDGVGVWIGAGDKNDVHVCSEGGGIALGHNTKDTSKLSATPLAVCLTKDEIVVQYKTCEENVSILKVCPEVFYKHFIKFLKAVRDETVAHPTGTTPAKLDE
jgi:hypothetical protein